MSEGSTYSSTTPNEGYVKRAADADKVSSGAKVKQPFDYISDDTNLSDVYQEMGQPFQLEPGGYRATGKVVLYGDGLTIAADTLLSVALGLTASIGIGSTFNFRDNSEMIGPMTTFTGFIKSFPLAPKLFTISDTEDYSIEMKINTAPGAGTLTATVYLHFDPVVITD